MIFFLYFLFDIKNGCGAANVARARVHIWLMMMQNNFFFKSPNYFAFLNNWKYYGREIKTQRTRRARIYRKNLMNREIDHSTIFFQDVSFFFFLLFIIIVVSPSLWKIKHIIPCLYVEKRRRWHGTHVRIKYINYY